MFGGAEQANEGRTHTDRVVYTAANVFQARDGNSMRYTKNGSRSGVSAQDAHTIISDLSAKDRGNKQSARGQHFIVVNACATVTAIRGRGT